MKNPNKYIKKYKEIDSINLRSVVRSCVLSTLSGLSKLTGEMSLGLKTNRIQFLYLHHVFDDEEFYFRRLIRVLSSEYRFISYSEAVERIWNGNIDGRYIVFSFDDGFKNCLRAAEIMREFGISACFFLCGAMIGETSYQKINYFCSQKIYMPPVEFLSWDDVESLLRKGHEVGSHTITHSNLAQLSSQKLQDEIGGSFALLSKRIGKIKHFSWPLGRFHHFSALAARDVFEAGFESCSSAERGCHIAQSDKISLCVRRDHILLQWPMEHIFYFMAKNIQKSSKDNNSWPQGWFDIIQGDA